MIAEADHLVFPVPRIQRPAPPRCGSHCARQRFHSQLSIWRLANEYVAMINHISLGCVGRKLTKGRRLYGSASRSGSEAPQAVAAPESVLTSRRTSNAHARFHTVALREATRLRRAHQKAVSENMPLIGAQCTAGLLKADMIDRYSVRAKAHAQVPMQAEAIDEPPRNSPVVELLEALPPEEREFYSREEHVVCWIGKSQVLFEEIEEHYSFVGGSHQEYAKYFQLDLPDRMWKFTTADQVKAVAGFSVVLKKNGKDQRKLLMQCSAVQCKLRVGERQGSQPFWTLWGRSSQHCPCPD